MNICHLCYPDLDMLDMGNSSILFYCSSKSFSIYLNDHRLIFIFEYVLKVSGMGMFQDGYAQFFPIVLEHHTLEFVSEYVFKISMWDIGMF